MNEIGYIYILTNKSFKDNCIKIGYSVDVERRVKDLSGSGLPYDPGQILRGPRRRMIMKYIVHMKFQHHLKQIKHFIN